MNESRRLRLLIMLSIAAAVVTIGLKTAAYLITGSVGLLSDALESGLNFVAAVTAYFSLWYSARPADRDHAYGHKKIEYFSSGLEGLLVMAAAGGIGWYAVERLIAPQPLESLGLGTLIAGLATVVNLLVGVLLIRAGKASGSIVLEADGHHLLTDVWTSVAVLGGLGLVALTGWLLLDPLVAIAVAANVLVTGFGLVRRSFNGLMDHALPEKELAVLRAAIRDQLPKDTAFHALRTRQAGSKRFIEFHLLVPGATTVREAHDLADRIESALAKALPRLEVTIHIEPIEAGESYETGLLRQLEEDVPKERTASPP